MLDTEIVEHFAGRNDDDFSFLFFEFWEVTSFASTSMLIWEEVVADREAKAVWTRVSDIANGIETKGTR